MTIDHKNTNKRERGGGRERGGRGRERGGGRRERDEKREGDITAFFVKQNSRYFTVSCQQVRAAATNRQNMC